ncbi:MAG TPA: DUF3560 domain-containing protein [Polyangiaceae bacterium]|jgi:hypothetical protein
MNATYDPADNKVRLRALSRLDAETYARVKAAGFLCAPKQDLFVAPAWTPEREDLLLDLCGEIGDEDTSLVERAEDRADRFEVYSDKREGEAHAAYEAAGKIAQRFEGGAPILVGHHSERRARKDAERIQNGMARSVRLWETSKYWTDRAAGALRAAKYKELPAVRHRRIKGLESDARKQQKTLDDAVRFSRLWETPDLTREAALRIANFDHVRLPPKDEREAAYGGESLWGALDKGSATPAECAARAIAVHGATVTRARRFLEHLEHRLAYERAMLGESGGIATDHHALEVGGQILARHWRTSRASTWCVIAGINKGASGAVVSVSTNVGVIPVECVSDYRAPEAGAKERVKAASKLPPLVNFPSEGCLELTTAEWTRKPKDYRQTRTVKATGELGAYRRREAWLPGGCGRTAPVYLTDAKRTDPPKVAAAPAPAPLEGDPAPLPPPRAPRAAPPPTVFDALKEQLRSGVAVQVVVADQLFPTPAPVAAQLLARAGVKRGDRVLEPSAGTGALVWALLGIGAVVSAVEIHPGLAERLPLDRKICADFLTLTPSKLPWGPFDRICMNPPFGNGADIVHILHARQFLAPGGRLVALCADGPRQRAKLRPLASHWESLPEGSFRESGTDVRVALLVLDAPATASDSPLTFGE